MIATGYIFALISAGAWAIAVITFKRIGDTVPPPVINLFKNTLGFVLIGLTLLTMGLPLHAVPAQEGVRIVQGWDIALIIFSGAIGIGLADIVFIRALNMIGASVTSIIGSMFSVFIFVFSFLFAFLFPDSFPGQRWPPTGLEIVGALFVILAIVYSSWTGISKKEIENLRSGIVTGISAILMMAFASVIMNSIVAKADKDVAISLWVVWVRLIPGIIVPLAIVLLGRYTQILRQVLRDPATLRILLFGAFMATYVAISFWTVGMAFESDNFTLFSVLAQTSNVFIFIMSWAVLSEQINFRRIIGITFSFIGIVMIMVGREPAEESRTNDTKIIDTVVNYVHMKRERI